MKKIVALIFLVYTALVTKAQIDPSLAGQLQAILENSVSNEGSNGVSAHLIMPNGEVWNGTAGVGKANLPISNTTLFHGASTTKFNMAVLALLLVEDSLLDLDESWSNYLSLDVDFDPSITLRQLLNHSSGIADYLETSSSNDNIIADFNRLYTPRYILENVISGVSLFPAGTSFQYSNSNYVLIGAIIEEVTGNQVHIEFRNRVWEPLGMNHTYFGAYETFTEPSAGVWWNFGNGLTNYSKMPTTSMLSYAYGAGNIVTCPTDLALLLDGILNGTLLSTQSLDEMRHFVPASYDSWTAGYGLGIHHVPGQSQDVLLGHDGYYTNMTSMFRSTNHGFTLVTMTNTQTEWFGIFNPMYDALSEYFMTTSVSESENDIKLSIYPNPSKSRFFVASSEHIDQIEVRNVLGQTIYSSKSYSENIPLLIDSNGLYFVIIKSGHQTLAQKLIIKK